MQRCEALIETFIGLKKLYLLGWQKFCETMDIFAKDCLLKILDGGVLCRLKPNIIWAKSYAIKNIPSAG